MARRADHTHDEIRAMAIKAAGEIIETQGLDALKIRPLARAIGYVPGTLYNIFNGFDDLMMQVNAETIDGLLARLQAAEAQTPPPDLRKLLLVYGGFALEHTNRWQAVFDYNLAEPDKVPDWYLQKINAGLAIVERAVARLAEGNPDCDPVATSRILWAGLHGIFSLGTEGNLKLVSEHSTNQLAIMFVSLITKAIRGPKPA